jgi:hypothetical protein
VSNAEIVETFKGWTLNSTMHSSNAIQYMNFKRSISPHITASVPAAYAKQFHYRPGQAHRVPEG